MIKQITLKNFYSFRDETIRLNRETNILIGINGSGKSNFLKALKLLVEGVAGVGLYNYMTDSLGTFDDIYFKGRQDENGRREIELQFVFDGQKLAVQSYGAHFKDDIGYLIKIINTPGSQNYFVEEHLFTITVSGQRDFEYLKFTNGVGFSF